MTSDPSGKPRLSIGLPVYNGEDYLAQSLDAVLGQTYQDFELVISSNASTDATDDICRDYQARDSRIRFFRQPRNIGAAPNHDFVFRQSRGELFKWVSADDLYARDLVSRCIALLDEHPEAVLAHCWTAAIDDDGTVIQAMEYPLRTDSSHAPERLRSMLLDGDLPGALRADDFYGVIRSEALRNVEPHGSFYHADYTFTAQLALLGPFLQVPEWLYFRRHHPRRLSLASINTACANLDPKRADRRRNPAARLVAEYVWSWFAAVRRAPLTPVERRECYRHIASWIASRASRRLPGRSGPAAPASFGEVAVLSVRAMVAGQEGS
ncbi:glycosyltransferase involved in cell wall biosynthesis [Kribbella antiqua]|uniref:Glycosyltransferase involved in cell wall biosynthesis n=1 Tax=Kribbella antiqua TaxID=2512217 RepID=A0A4R2J690_9ACTN|nr:glycosyltransferase family 2 protein [Kribbella antiqua]TCO52068.1 glycosyltransferase involved in cell wall biosynthesis [Kribbella antiqua]